VPYNSKMYAGTETWDHKLLAKLETAGERVPSLVFVAAIGLLMIAAFAVARGGLIHWEAEKYIPHYLSDRPVLEKIYDYKQVELEAEYRPRPLSYLVDDLDVAFIGWSAAKGYAHFESLSYYLFWALNAILLWHCLRNLFQLDRLNSGLLIVLLSTSPIIFLNTYYFRSAKTGSSFFLICGFIVLWGCYQRVLRGRPPAGRLIGAMGAFVLVLAACLFDEIPVALCLAAVLMLGLELYLRRGTSERKAAAFCLVPLIAALASFAIYDLWIHRRLVTYFTGETAQMGFQAGMLHALISSPHITILGTASVLTESLGYLTGNLSSALVAAGLGLLLVFWNRSSGRDAATRYLAGLVLMFGILFGMVSREHYIIREVPRRTFYTYPFSFVFLLFLGFCAWKMIDRRLLSRGALHAILLTLIASNLTSLPTNWTILQSDQDRLNYSRAMVTALRSPDGITGAMRADPDLGKSYSLVEKSKIYSSMKQVMAHSNVTR
jgi:hypothetical protein